MAAAETAYRLNPRYPLWYDGILSRLHFQLGHYAEPAALLEKPIFDGSPARSLRAAAMKPGPRQPAIFFRWRPSLSLCVREYGIVRAAV
jgi:hypothetical protein